MIRRKEDVRINAREKKAEMAGMPLSRKEIREMLNDFSKDKWELMAITKTEVFLGSKLGSKTKLSITVKSLRSSSLLEVPLSVPAEDTEEKIKEIKKRFGK